MSSSDFPTANVDCAPDYAVVLCGGAGRRMQGADKPLQLLAGQPMVASVVAAARASGGQVLISANRNMQEYARYGHPVIADQQANEPGLVGPLAGVQAALRWIQQSGRPSTLPQYCWLLPGDAPDASGAVAAELVAAAGGAERVLVPHDGSRQQPLFALISTGLAGNLDAFVAGGGRKVLDWFDDVGAAQVDCSAYATSFRNINTLTELTAPARAR